MVPSGGLDLPLPSSPHRRLRDVGSPRRVGHLGPSHGIGDVGVGHLGSPEGLGHLGPSHGIGHLGVGDVGPAEGLGDLGAVAGTGRRLSGTDPMGAWRP